MTGAVDGTFSVPVQLASNPAVPGFEPFPLVDETELANWFANVGLN